MKRNDGVNIKGFFRTQIVDKKGKIVGDSGWKKNTITVNGLAFCIGGLPLKHTGAYDAEFGAIGTGAAAVDSNATAVVGLLSADSDSYIALVTQAMSTSASGATARVTFQYDGSLGATGNIGNVGLFSAQTVGGMVAGNTFNTSALATNQSVNVTYEFRFATA